MTWAKAVSVKYHLWQRYWQCHDKDRWRHKTDKRSIYDSKKFKGYCCRSSSIQFTSLKKSESLVDYFLRLWSTLHSWQILTSWGRTSRLFHSRLLHPRSLPWRESRSTNALWWYHKYDHNSSYVLPDQMVQSQHLFTSSWFLITLNAKLAHYFRTVYHAECSVGPQLLISSSHQMQNLPSLHTEDAL